MNNGNFSTEILRKSDEKLFLDIPVNTFLIVCPLIPHACDISNYSMVMNLRKFQEMLKEREAWHAAVHGVAKTQT